MLRELNSLNRKKYQRALNKIVKKFNQSIKDDWLWNGRFVMHQEEAYFKSFEDHSGALFDFMLVLVDTKTGREEAKYFDNYNVEWYMYEWANWCITEVWKVWSEDPKPSEQARSEGRAPQALII